MVNDSLIVLGAGGHGKVVADCAKACGWNDVAFLDDRYPDLDTAGEWPVIGKCDLTGWSPIVASGEIPTKLVQFDSRLNTPWKGEIFRSVSDG